MGAKNHCVQHISIYRYNSVHYQIISHIWKRLMVITSILKQKLPFFCSVCLKIQNTGLTTFYRSLYCNLNIHRPKTVSHKKQTKKRHLRLMCLSQFWGNCELFLATSLYLDAHLSKVKKKKKKVHLCSTNQNVCTCKKNNKGLVIFSRFSCQIPPYVAGRGHGTWKNQRRWCWPDSSESWATLFSLTL